MKIAMWTLVVALILLNGTAAVLWLVTARFRFVLTAPRLASRIRGFGQGLGQRLRPTATAPSWAGLDSWIDEVERNEATERAQPQGSEAWWREWADSGGALPEAAESRRNPAPRDLPAA